MKRRMLLSAVGTNTSIDLELEGSLSGVTTISQLATFLGVAISKISYWETTGIFIKVAIKGNYNIPQNQFANNTTLTKFRDIGGVVETINNQTFRNTKLTELLLPKLKYANGNAAIGYNTLLTVINLPNLIVHGQQVFRGNSATTEIYAPHVEEIGSVAITGSNDFGQLTSLNILDLRKLKVYNNPATGYGATTSGFASLKVGCEIRVNIALATANSGAVNESLRYAKNLRGAIVKFYDDNGNYVSTL